MNPLIKEAIMFSKCNILKSLVVVSSFGLSSAILAAESGQVGDKLDEMKRANLSGYHDGDAIVVTGNILSVSEGELMLNYAGRKVKIEFDKWPWEGKDMEKYFEVGQKVTVSGRVDKDWFSSNEIEANNIYLDDQYVYYYWLDQSPAYYLNIGPTNMEKSANGLAGGDVGGASFSVSGEIKAIHGREFTLQSGEEKFTVDTESLGYNPLDNVGLQQLRVGDHVYVFGDVDAKFFDEKRFSADSVITLQSADKMPKDDKLVTSEG